MGLRSFMEKTLCSLGTKEMLNGGPQGSMRPLAMHVHLGCWAMGMRKTWMLVDLRHFPD